VTGISAIRTVAAVPAHAALAAIAALAAWARICSWLTQMVQVFAAKSGGSTVTAVLAPLALAAEPPGSATPAVSAACGDSKFA
jgi:hypothetical protein